VIFAGAAERGRLSTTFNPALTTARVSTAAKITPSLPTTHENSVRNAVAFAQFQTQPPLPFALVLPHLQLAPVITTVSRPEPEKPC